MCIQAVKKDKYLQKVYMNNTTTYNSQTVWNKKYKLHLFMYIVAVVVVVV